MEAIAFIILLVVCRFDISSADPSQLVTKLPGQPQVQFSQYAGHVTVNASTGKAFFYWFYGSDAANSSSSMPLVLWLNGGPGCSSVGSGALGELGPFQPGGNSLVLNPYAWNKAANLIFLESPVGVGFSYSNTSSDYDAGAYTDAQTAKDNLSFLVEWFHKFPEYSKNDFFITGESYAGHYIPTLASEILAYNANGGSINFKGFAIGNPWTAESYEMPGNTEFLYTHSLISDEVYIDAMNNCYSSNGNSVKCSEAQNGIFAMTKYVNRYNVYKDGCSVVTVNAQNGHRQVLKEWLWRVYAACQDDISSYLNSPDVQAALHVQNRPVRWSTCNHGVRLKYSNEDFSASMLPVYKNLLKAGIRIWIYSGDFDSVVSTLSTRSWIKVLNMTINTPWYPWNHENQVGGWAEVYSGITFTTIRGAGHMVPGDQGGSALAMFRSFLQGKKSTNFLNKPGPQNVNKKDMSFKTLKCAITGMDPENTELSLTAVEIKKNSNMIQ